MDLLGKVLFEWSVRCEKGYPDFNNEQDLAIFESMFGFNLLSEKKLEWKDLSSDTRKFIRLEVIANKIKEGSPFKLESGEEKVLKFTKEEYFNLFYNQEVEKIRKISRSINRVPFFKDAEGSTYTFHDITKTPDLGGTGKSKAESSERQERSLIAAINEFKGKPFDLVGKNGKKITGITGAQKMPDPPEGEAYSDIVIKTSNGDINISAKGSASPSIAGGGLKMASNLGPEVESFIEEFYYDAYEHYKKIFESLPDIDYSTNLYRTPYFKDINRAVPKDIMRTILTGIERFGGPVHVYYTVLIACLI